MGRGEHSKSHFEKKTLTRCYDYLDRVPPSSFSGDGAYEFPAPMDIENDQEIETSRDVENPQKSDDLRNDDPMETENSVNLEEHADLVEAGESWVESSMPGKQPLCLFVPRCHRNTCEIGH